MDEELNGKIQAVQEFLEAVQDGVLFRLRFKVKVYAVYHKNGAQGTVFQVYHPVFNILNLDELLCGSGSRHALIISVINSLYLPFFSG